MREQIINNLNALLEIDHDTVYQAIIEPVELPIESPLKSTDSAILVRGVHCISALSILTECCEIEPIQPVFEDGVIQRFE